MAYTYDDFVKIIERLRSQGGCPWDREQTHQSLIPNLIEEAYEVIDAIKENNSENLCEELGDVLLQVVMHSQIAKEENEFTINDVINIVAEKMVRRHPHVFSDTIAKTSDEVLKNWEEIKKGEKNLKTPEESLKTIPTHLPALMRAEKVQKKASKLGVDYNNPYEIIENIKENLVLLEKTAVEEKSNNYSEILGGMLFEIVAFSRLKGDDPEQLLTDFTNNFIKNFSAVEKPKPAQE